MKTNPKIDLYLMDGCGRCKLYATPQCKVHTWAEELDVLRGIVLETGLTEELKWSMPCYTWEGKNILIMAAFKEYASIAFFKGSLLKDEKKLLHAPGENSQASRSFRFTNVKDITKNKSAIKAYIKEAIELEKSGAKIEFKKIEDRKIPIEFENALKKNPSLKKAFEALTPGRQRSYLIHFESAKQSATREARIEKCIPKIKSGKGFNEY